MSKLLRLSEDKLKVGLFAPLDRETPIAEVTHDDEVLFDISFFDDSEENQIELTFHDAISGVCMDSDIFKQILEKAYNRLNEEV